MNGTQEVSENECSSVAPPRRLDAAESEDDDEESMAGSVLHVSLHTPHLISPRKAAPVDLWRTHSAVAWCAKSGLIACASEVCAKNPRLGADLSFWIPIHIILPERPTEHAVFNVMAESPWDYIEFLEWSPPMCERALLVGTSSGRVYIWMQPAEGGSNVARAINCWNCENEWKQDQAVTLKWLSGVSPYQWSPSTANGPSKQTFEEKFLGHKSRASARWPNILCVCSVSVSGSVHLHWRQWHSSGAQKKWFCSKKGILGAGKSDLITADAIVSESGSLLIAGVPAGNPSTVVIWDVSPLPTNNQESNQQMKPGMASWSGLAPLPSVLIGWYDGSLRDTKTGTDTSNLQPTIEAKAQFPSDMRLQPTSINVEVDAPPLQCSPVSNLSAYVASEASRKLLNSLGSGIMSIAFDPSKAGSSLVILLNEDEQPLISYRVQRWESSRKQVGLHPLFEPAATTTYSGSSPLTTTGTIWQSIVDKTILVSKRGDDLRNYDERYVSIGSDQPSPVKSHSKIVFASHGAELAVATAYGEVHVFSGSSLSLIDNYYLKVGILPTAPAFSPSGCCLSTVWHDTKRDCSVLRIMRVTPPVLAAAQGSGNNSTWERGLADRFWWSLLNGIDWWDAVGCTHSAVEDGLVTIHKVIAVLDADFHALPSLSHRQYYSHTLDQIKCRMLEGVDGVEVRVVVLDMQARLLLEMLGKGIEAALTNPGTFLAEPWMASTDVLSGLADAMTVDPALQLHIQPYVDAVLDLASHFLTRLRRYASFCRTLASHAAGNASSNPRLSNSTSASTGASSAPSQAQLNNSLGTSSTSNGTNPVQAWVQGAITKVNNAEGVTLTSSGSAGTVTPLALIVNQSAFPGMPSVRRQQPPRMPPVTMRNSDGTDGPDEPGRGGRIGNGNAGQGYVIDEVKYLFLVLVNLCKKTSTLAHPMPKSQVGSSNPSIRLHYPDGQYSVPPEVVEASVGHHIQNLPRPRGADSAGLLMRELELHPPAEDWSKRNLYGGPWAGALEMYSPSDDLRSVDFDTKSPVSDYLQEEMSIMRDLWPRKRRYAERDTAYGQKTAAEMGSFFGFMGSRRDIILAAWKNSAHGTWHKCSRCGRQTGALSTPNTNSSNSSPEAWWTGRWAYACPMCGGSWIRIV